MRVPVRAIGLTSCFFIITAERIAERETKLAKDATHRAEHVDASIAAATHELELKMSELEAQCEVRIKSASEQLTRASVRFYLFSHCLPI
jgi:hypothetical protein